MIENDERGRKWVSWVGNVDVFLGKKRKDGQGCIGCTYRLRCELYSTLKKSFNQQRYVINSACGTHCRLWKPSPKTKRGGSVFPRPSLREYLVEWDDYTDYTFGCLYENIHNRRTKTTDSPYSRSLFIRLYTNIFSNIGEDNGNG